MPPKKLQLRRKCLQASGGTKGEAVPTEFSSLTIGDKFTLLPLADFMSIVFRKASEREAHVYGSLSSVLISQQFPPWYRVYLHPTQHSKQDVGSPDTSPSPYYIPGGVIRSGSITTGVWVCTGCGYHPAPVEVTRGTTYQCPLCSGSSFVERPCTPGELAQGRSSIPTVYIDFDNYHMRPPQVREVVRYVCGGCRSYVSSQNQPCRYCGFDGPHMPA